ncbi:hypothetical protein HMPREF9141_1438 [Prevotella multiformis DSM 16608]|uniref:Uncharacterized protein n=1 Tax=Prevotella multiformis DSM 16608 TaxID=888743 RepID=F0F771_9BACT|nr:hypothetical protein HMPREF9141_1438 [Prevotella multiformis DSM 16608]
MADSPPVLPVREGMCSPPLHAGNAWLVKAMAGSGNPGMAFLLQRGRVAKRLPGRAAVCVRGTDTAGAGH